MGPLKSDYMGSNITQVVEACLDISFSYSCASLCGCLRGGEEATFKDSLPNEQFHS